MNDRSLNRVEGSDEVILNTIPIKIHSILNHMLCLRSLVKQHIHITIIYLTFKVMSLKVVHYLIPIPHIDDSDNTL